MRYGKDYDEHSNHWYIIWEWWPLGSKTLWKYMASTVMNIVIIIMWHGNNYWWDKRLFDERKGRWRKGKNDWIENGRHNSQLAHWGRMFSVILSWTSIVMRSISVRYVDHSHGHSNYCYIIWDISQSYKIWCPFFHNVAMTTNRIAAILIRYGKNAPYLNSIGCYFLLCAMLYTFSLSHSNPNILEKRTES